MRTAAIVAGGVLLITCCSARSQDVHRASLCLFCGVRATAPFQPPPRSLPRFWEAAGSLVAAELVPWAFDRWVTHEEYAYISVGTVRENFRTGFEFDHDDFTTNQFLHRYHGGLFFNAARANGFDYYASGLFSLAGSLGWECCLENTAPSLNDLVNTTLGGMALGEITHRLATVLRDNQATGSGRFWRELGGVAIDPVGGFERLVHGEWVSRFPNPDERYPRGFELSAALGYGHVAGDNADADRGLLTISAAYGDPFAGAIGKPFDSFWVEADLNAPGDVITRVEGRGILRGRELTDAGAPFRAILGVWQQYEYFRNEAQVFGGQALSLGLLARHRRGALAATADLALVVFPLGGIRTVDTTDSEADLTYDYAPGAGVRAGGRLDTQRGRVAAAYGAAWLRTVDGASQESVLQFLRVSAQLTLSKALGVGAGWSWYSRRTTYPDLFEGRRTQSEWRVYAAWGLSGSAPEPKTQIPQ